MIFPEFVPRTLCFIVRSGKYHVHTSIKVRRGLTSPKYQFICVVFDIKTIVADVRITAPILEESIRFSFCTINDGLTARTYSHFGKQSGCL